MKYLVLSIACIIATSAASAEERFNRPLIKLADPASYQYFKLDDNKFPVIQRGPVSITCMTYRGSERYYVEIGILNQSKEKLSLSPNFVTFDKPGYTMLLTNTIDVAAKIRTSAAQDVEPDPPPPPPPTRTTTTYSGTTQTYGNTTTSSGTATTTRDNQNAGWYALGQALAARSLSTARTREETFALYLTRFAHEQQELFVPPGQLRTLIFTFAQLKPKKAPFVIRVVAGAETFEFKYRE